MDDCTEKLAGRLHAVFLPEQHTSEEIEEAIKALREDETMTVLRVFDSGRAVMQKAAAAAKDLEALDGEVTAVREWVHAHEAWMGIFNIGSKTLLKSCDVNSLERARASAKDLASRLTAIQENSLLAKVVRTKLHETEETLIERGCMATSVLLSCSLAATLSISLKLFVAVAGEEDKGGGTYGGGQLFTAEEYGKWKVGIAAAKDDASNGTRDMIVALKSFGTKKQECIDSMQEHVKAWGHAIDFATSLASTLEHFGKARIHLRDSAPVDGTTIQGLFDGLKTIEPGEHAWSSTCSAALPLINNAVDAHGTPLQRCVVSVQSMLKQASESQWRSASGEVIASSVDLGEAWVSLAKLTGYGNHPFTTVVPLKLTALPNGDEAKDLIDQLATGCKEKAAQASEKLFLANSSAKRNGTFLHTWFLLTDFRAKLFELVSVLMKVALTRTPPTEWRVAPPLWGREGGGGKEGEYQPSYLDVVKSVFDETGPNIISATNRYLQTIDRHKTT